MPPRPTKFSERDAAPRVEFHAFFLEQTPLLGLAARVADRDVRRPGIFATEHALPRHVATERAHGVAHRAGRAGHARGARDVTVGHHAATRDFGDHAPNALERIGQNFSGAACADLGAQRNNNAQVAVALEGLDVPDHALQLVDDARPRSVLPALGQVSSETDCSVAQLAPSPVS